MRRPFVIAHRGDSTNHAENTLPAYQAAIVGGADLIELDVHLTRDHVPVCLHNTFFHHDNKKVYVSDLTFAQIAKMRGGGIHHIPSLEEVLELERGRTGLMIELKTGRHDSKTLVEQVARLVERAGQGSKKGRIVFGSFSLEILEMLKAHHSQADIVGIVEKPNRIASLLAGSPFCIAIDARIANQKRILEIKDSGSDVWVWTVNDPKLAKSLFQQGVSGIITDDPIGIDAGIFPR